MSSKENENRTIEDLEKDYWAPPSTFPTELVKKVFLLRQKRLKDFDSNDLRILISQNVGLKFLVPKVINILQNDILHEAIYYPGDLLSAILDVESNYWVNNPLELSLFVSILKKSKYQINIDNESDEVDEELITSINKFLSKYDDTNL